MKRIKIFALLMAALLLLTGCAAQKSAAYEPMAMADAASGENYSVSSYAQLSGNSMAEVPAEAAPQAKETADSETGYSKKIIYTANLSLRADDPAAALAPAETLIAAEDGYVASSYSTVYEDGTAYAYATLKVPADRLDALLSSLGELGEEESCRVESDDISLDYYDIYARLAAAKAEESQLLSILGDCKTVEEVLLVREQLSSVRENIESYQARINLWDHQVAYATVELNIRETQKAAVAGEGTVIELWQASDVWKRISTGFQNSWRFVLNALSAIGIALAYALLPLAVLAALVFGIVKLISFLRRKTAPKRAARAEKRAAKQAEELEKRAKKAAEKLEKQAERKP